ncbi:LIC_11548 family sensor histidine kinase [Leptospira sp. GIMC2001]|uniref:LIC_11548 family sensor histidine kinase n=1 Tax=Leptospira sp. GIMC2001 TaxID=1513297 RepID=UPI002349ABF2|nr:ATP-binding protein [Leptospira sp. GIMC2001]WCL47913.1 ATP-binding protein [Leptospira sp. GIMC2001]
MLFKGPKNDEIRYYLRDLFVFTFSISLGIFFAEFFYFSGRDEIPVLNKLDSYVIFVLPFFVFSVIMSYIYRNKRNIETGKIRSSIRYRLTLAFLFVALLPSVPIFILSSNLTGKLMETFYRVDITNALNSSLELIKEIENKDRVDLIAKATHMNNWLGKKNISEEDFLVEAFRIGMLDYNTYYMGLFNVDGSPLLETISLKERILPELFSIQANEILPSYTLYRADRSFILAKIKWNPAGYVLIGKRIHQNNYNLVYNIVSVKNSYEALNLWKEKIPSGVRLAIGLFSIFMFGFSIFFSFLFARKISRPIITLANATTKVSSGETNISLDLKEEGEMGILIDSFNQMVKDLRSKNEELMHIQRVAAWKEVAQRMAHEIKNPLTPIQLSAERIRKRFETNTKPEKLKEVILESTETIINQVRVLEHLVKEFSEFARMPVPTLVNQSLNPILEESIRLFQESTDIKIERKLMSNLPEVFLDRRLFLGVINNLIKNAVEAIQENPNPDKVKIIRVQSRLERKIMKRIITVTIEDSGLGLHPELRKKIFEPYYSTKEKHGSGIGLAIVQKTIIDHHGHISVSDSKLGGCKFSIELPTSISDGKT